MTSQNIIRLLFAIFMIMMQSGTVVAQPAALKKYYDKIGSLQEFNGNVLLSSKGGTVLQRSYGMADIGLQRPNTAGTHFNLASISKIFTATAILQLKEKKLLKLDDPVFKYLPSFPYREISLRHLLTHTSGLPDQELFGKLVKQYPDTIVHNSDILPELLKEDHALYFAPGEQFRYNNNGYNLLAMVVEKISGLSFSRYLEKYIFKPAGMSSTYLNGMDGMDVKNDPSFVTFHVRLHSLYDSTYTPVDSVADYRFTNFNISANIGCSNIISTSADLQLFDKAFFFGMLLDAATIKEAFTPAKLNNGKTISGRMETMQGEGVMYHGLGWEIFDQPLSGISVGHGGYKFGLATFYAHHLATNTAVIAYSNAPGGDYGGIVSSGMLLLQGMAPIPISEKRSLVAAYGTSLVHTGKNEAASLLNFYKKDSTNYYLSEWEMNELGYDLFYKSKFKDHQELALETFKLATLLFPDSYNTYDSYGQLLAEMGMKKAAIQMYVISVQLNPQNEDGKRVLQKLRE